MSIETEPHWQHSALLTIDVQCDFLSDGVSAVPGTSEVVPALARLTAAFRSADRPIIHVVRLYLPDGSNADISRRATIAAGAMIARPGTPGAELAPGLTATSISLDSAQLLRGELQHIGPNEFVLFKPRWNAFFGTNLDGWLRSHGVDTVVVAGCNFPNCPRGTLFGASERDYRAVAVSNAISRWATTSASELDGIGVHVNSVDEVVSALHQTEAAATNR